MTVAVDSNVILDVLAEQSEHLAESKAKLLAAADNERVILCEAAYAEVASQFADDMSLDSFLSDWQIVPQSSTRQALHAAGVAWRRYTREPRRFTCPECGATQQVRCERCGSLVTRRQHVVADFMIGAHALVHAGRLLTRDRGYYARYFPELVLP